jgi:hypothetical protein
MRRVRLDSGAMAGHLAKLSKKGWNNQCGGLLRIRPRNCRHGATCQSSDPEHAKHKPVTCLWLYLDHRSIHNFLQRWRTAQRIWFQAFPPHEEEITKKLDCAGKCANGPGGGSLYDDAMLDAVSFGPSLICCCRPDIEAKVPIKIDSSKWEVWKF